MSNDTTAKMAAQTSSTPKPVVFLGLSAIILLVFVVYFQTLSSDFVNLDDPHYIIKNKAVQELSWKSVVSFFSTTVTKTYSPIVLLSFTIEHHFVGLAPKIYHLDNLILHCLNCILVFLFIRLISKKYLVSLVTTLLFAIHPIHVESVAWITERKDLLFSLFFFAALIFYINYRNTYRFRYYLITLGCILFSYLAKPQAALFAAVLLAIDYFIYEKFSVRILLEKIPFILIAMVFLLVQYFNNANEISEVSVASASTLFLNATYALLFYLSKIVLPVNLSCGYQHPSITGGTILTLYQFSPLAVALLFGAAVYSLRWTKTIAFAGLFFFLNICMMLFVGALSETIVADRYTYIPALGIYLLVANAIGVACSGTRQSSRILKYGVISGFLCIAVVLSYLSWHRCSVWKNSETLWSDTLRKNPEYALGRGNYGVTLLENGDYKGAIEQFNEAIRIDSTDIDSYNNMGSVLAYLGDIDNALRLLRKSLQINPKSPITNCNLGGIMIEAGDIDGAIPYLEKAILLDPGSLEAHNNLAIAHKLLREKQSKSTK